MERAADLAAHDLGLCGAGLDQRRLGHHVRIALELAVQPFDAGQLRGRGLHRRDLACVDAARQFGQVKIVEG